MAVPKRKMSRSNTRHRRSQWKAAVPTLVSCERCQEPKLQHIACPSCGTYNKRRFGLNLFTFIIAPAASGKGTLAWARRLAWPYHKALTDASCADRLDYDAELAA